MKKRQLQELRGKTLEEVKKELSNMREAGLKHVAAVAAGREKNLAAARNIRRDIAQILSILSERKGQGDKK